jgi:hypothetical protein
MGTQKKRGLLEWEGQQRKVSRFSAFAWTGTSILARSDTAVHIHHAQDKVLRAERGKDSRPGQRVLLIWL